MVWCRVLAIAGLAACVSGCAQGRDAPRARIGSQEPPLAPVPTRGPDDGLPFASPRNHAPTPADDARAAPAHDAAHPQGGARAAQ